MRYFLLICLLLSIGCRKDIVSNTHDSAIKAPWPDNSLQHPKSEVFNALLNKYIKKGLPGISMLVSDKDGIWVGAAGKADIEKNIDFYPGQVSKIASITKLFIGTLAFKLFEDSSNTHLGYRSLYQPIATWLPQRIIKKLPNGNKITFGQLLNHESGIPDLIEDESLYLAILNNTTKQWRQEELLEFIYDNDPEFSPGDTAIYSNTNTLIASLIMEYATGRSHAELLKQYIIQPLGLENTYYQTHEPLPNTVAQGYFDLYNNSSLINVSNINTGSGNGYGGHFSNIYDLYRFIDALLIKKTLLNPKSLLIMETYGKPDFPNQYGFGIMKKFIDRGINAGFGHSGRDLGYTGNLFYFPNKKVTHAFLINYGTDAKSKLREVFDAFQTEFLDITLQ
jgi:D-alanyl-D-alanine carboxypeptidase